MNYVSIEEVDHAKKIKNYQSKVIHVTIVADWSTLINLVR